MRGGAAAQIPNTKTETVWESIFGVTSKSKDPGQLALVGVCAGSENARFSKGQMPAVADDDVVKNFDAQDAARVHKPPCHAKVRVGWCRVPARVIVHEHKGVRRADDRRAEHFARVSH